MTVDIYDSVVNDIPEIRELIKTVLNTPYESDKVKHLMKQVYSVDSFQKTIDSENRHLIVAIREDAIVGVCQYGIPIMDDCDCEDLRSIQFLFVHPETDHHEIASALVYDVEETLDAEAGVQRLSVFVNQSMLPLIKFYAGLGFVHDQVEDIEGEWYMEKYL